MKRFFKWSGITAFAALLPLLMAPTGGFPTNPFLRGLFANNSVGINACSGSASVVCIKSTAAHTAYAETISVATSNSLGLHIAGMPSLGVVGDDLLAIDANGATVFKISGNGNITSGVAHGLVNTTGATCSVAGGPGTFTACTHTGTGQYTVTTTGLSSTGPMCTVSTQGTNQPVSVTASSATSVLVTTFTTAFAAADSTLGINVICVNNF